MNHNLYRAYWEKAQEQSLKLAQYYTPECLVELCIELLKPTGELFDPCCGLGSFLLKAKAKDEIIKISGNDIAKDLGELPFEFTNSDYLNNGIDKEFDYVIANIPFNSKKTHCQLIDENYCWIEKIIKNTRKKSLIILPDRVNWLANKRIVEKRKTIIESGVLELVIKLPPFLFNQTSIAPVIWFLDKEKKDKNIHFLNAERFSVKKRKNCTITEENIQQICDKSNWGLATYEQIKKYDDYLLMVNVFDTNAFSKEPKKTPEEIKQEIQILAKEIKQIYEETLSGWNELKQLLEGLEKEGELIETKEDV